MPALGARAIVVRLAAHMRNPRTAVPILLPGQQCKLPAGETCQGVGVEERRQLSVSCQLENHWSRMWTAFVHSCSEFHGNVEPGIFGLKSSWVLGIWWAPAQPSSPWSPFKSNMPEQSALFRQCRIYFSKPNRVNRAHWLPKENTQKSYIFYISAAHEKFAWNSPELGQEVWVLGICWMLNRRMSPWSSLKSSIALQVKHARAVCTFYAIQILLLQTGSVDSRTLTKGSTVTSPHQRGMWNAKSAKNGTSTGTPFLPF